MSVVGMAKRQESLKQNRPGDHGLTCERRRWTRWYRAHIHSPGACHMGTPGWRGRGAERLRTWAPRLAAAVLGAGCTWRSTSISGGDHGGALAPPSGLLWQRRGSPAVMLSSLQAVSMSLSTSPTTMDCTCSSECSSRVSPPGARSRLPPGSIYL